MSSEGLAKNNGEQNKIRNEYKENLRKIIENEEKNYRINNEFYKNGILPASSQIMDVRSANDKLNDILFLKQKIAKDMEELGSPDFISKIVDGLSKSPLNLDNKLIQYTAQNGGEIAKSIKRRYEIGIRGDTNDVVLLVKFIENMYTETKATFKSINDYIKSSVNQSKSGAIDGETIKKNLNEILRKLSLYSNLLRDNEGLLPLPANPNANLNILQQNIATMNAIINKISKIYKAIPDNNTLQRLMKNVPEYGEYTAGIPHHNIIGEKADFVLNSELLSRVLELFYNLPDYLTINNLLGRVGRSLEQKNYNHSLTILKEINSLYTLDATNEKYLEFLRNVANPNLNAMDFDIEDIHKRQELIEQTRAANQPVIPIVKVINPDENTPLRVQGNGLKKRRGRPLGSGMPKPIVIKEPRFIGFGINEINNEKLKNNVLSIRRKTKTNIMGMPQRNISEKFKGIIKTILGGGMPKYKELEALDDEEKDYLYKIVSKSELEDKLSIPAPSKDKHEKMVNEFEIMKGQIMSGNDNREYVKKFKLLVLKLVRNGYIPKNQAYELVEELTTLGY
jgi:hypothetical protein